MKVLGRHALVEFHECDPEVINNISKIQRIMLEAARQAKVTIIDSIFHKFSPQGISGVIVIAESHFAIHTWPEYRYAAVDFFTCGESMDPLGPQDYLAEALGAKTVACVELKRGIIREPVRETVPAKNRSRERVGAVARWSAPRAGARSVGAMA